MYEPPIQMIVAEMKNQIEEQEGQILMKEVRGVGFDVDKHELMKALAYDRDQYRKGYNDAMRNAVPLEPLCKWLSLNYGAPCNFADSSVDDICETDGAGKCYGMDKPGEECWKYLLTKTFMNKKEE